MNIIIIHILTKTITKCVLKKIIKTKYQIVLILIEYFLLFVYKLPQHGITIFIKLIYNYIR